jgi:phage shock protein C
MTKRLYRSRQHKVFAGVCGGLGEYFDIDPAFIRILAMVLILVHGIGLIAYLVALIAMPRAPLQTAPTAEDAAASVVEPAIPPKEPSALNKYFPGIILIALGLIFLADRLIWWFHWRYMWPLILIAIGAAMLWKSYSHHKNNGGLHESI